MKAEPWQNRSPTTAVLAMIQTLMNIGNLLHDQKDGFAYEEQEALDVKAHAGVYN